MLTNFIEIFMKIQDLTISNNLKKKIIKAIADDTVVMQEENGDVVVNVAGYVAMKKNSKTVTLEDILGQDLLDFDVDYFVFS